MLERFKYVSINEDQEDDIETVRVAVMMAFHAINDYCPSSRGKALALTKLEEAQYWANKSICGNDK